MSKFVGYRCSLCGTEYLPGQVTYTCPKDGGNLDIVLDYDAIRKKYQPEDILSRKDASLWRYLPFCLSLNLKAARPRFTLRAEHRYLTCRVWVRSLD